MVSNDWSFTGVVRKFGENRHNDSSWGKIWMQIELPAIINKVMANSIMLTVPTVYGISKEAERTNKLKKDLKEGAFVFVHGAKVDNIKRGKKTDDGWENYYEVGVKAYPKNIIVSNTRFEKLNLGIVAGKVSDVGESIFTVEESYIVPTTSEWKTRPIPIHRDDKHNISKGKYVYAHLELAGRSPDGEYKTMGFIQTLIVI